MINGGDLNFFYNVFFSPKIKKTIVFPFIWSDVLWASLYLFEKVA